MGCTIIGVLPILWPLWSACNGYCCLFNIISILLTKKKKVKNYEEKKLFLLKMKLHHYKHM